jgi:short-subunit dehydrogenase
MQQNKVVIITGASSGFGCETALLAAKRGYRVVLAARRAERLMELAKQIENDGGTVVAVPCDVTKGEDQQRLIDAALQEYGQIDILVNNAGVPLAQGFIDASLDDLRRQWETNVLSIVELTKRALPALIATRGIVINISSLASRMSLPGWGLYFPTKVAASSLSDTLRRELMPYGIRVCIVEPGPFQTEFYLRAGTPPEQNFGLPPEWVSRSIVRLFEHPKRMTVVPSWMRPFGALIDALMRSLPGSVDLVFWIRTKLR